MRLICLVSLLASFIAVAEVPSKPDYRCVANRAYGITYDEDGPYPVKFNTDSVFFLMHISNIPDKTLEEISKSSLFFDEGVGKGMPNSSVEEIRESFNYIASMWNPLFDSLTPDLKKFVRDKAERQGVYFIRRSNENPSEAGHYYPSNVCRHVTDYNDRPAIACYNAMPRDSFIFSLYMGKFEYSSIGSWVDWVPKAGEYRKPDSSYFEQGSCEEYYR